MSIEHPRSRIPEHGGVLKWDRHWIATVLTLQVAVGAALGIAAKVFLVWVIIGYVMPWFGADLLRMARDIAAFKSAGAGGAAIRGQLVAGAGSANLLGHSLGRRRAGSLGLGIMIRPDLAERERRRGDPPTRCRSFPRFTAADCGARTEPEDNRAIGTALTVPVPAT